MELRIVMADPAGNRTAIVRSPVPARDRAAVAGRIMRERPLRAEQVGFALPPACGGVGRLEMMGGEFCGNAARSYGFLLWMEKLAVTADGMPGRAAFAQKGDGAFPAGMGQPGRAAFAQKGDGAFPAGMGQPGRAAAVQKGKILIEISGAAQALEVHCEMQEGVSRPCALAGRSFARMPMPEKLEHTEEGYPLVVSEGIAHVILEGLAPSQALVDAMVGRYGQMYPALGLQFLAGDGALAPAVYVAGADSLVWESSCGSGSLAVAWYLWQKGGPAACGGAEPGEMAEYVFSEPGGEIGVRLWKDACGRACGSMGGGLFLEPEARIVL